MFVSEDKIIRYLLENRPGRARDKSKLFSRFGYDISDAQFLREQIISIAEQNEVQEIRENDYGILYSVTGLLKVPDKRTLMLKTVGHVLDGTAIARFVTAYPEKT